MIFFLWRRLLISNNTKLKTSNSAIRRGRARYRHLKQNIVFCDVTTKEMYIGVVYYIGKVRLRKCEFIENARASSENNCQKARPHSSFNANARNWKFTQIKCTQFNNKLPRGFAFIVVLLLRFTCRCRYIFLCRKCFSQRAHILYFNVYTSMYFHICIEATHDTARRGGGGGGPLCIISKTQCLQSITNEHNVCACICGHRRIWKGPHFIIF